MNMMEGLPSGGPITLVVKAPNQKVTDQTIECFLDWNVKRLKTHLSTVYPNKPTEKNQRIIYSGKLLQDNVVLKDVLRQHDDTRQHTVHLVCSSVDEPCSLPTSTAERNPHNSTESGASTPSSRRSSTSTTPSSNDGVRHRTPTGANYPNYYQYGYGNYPGMQYGQAGGSNPYYAPNAQQAYWMQQMYAHQMAQYMQYSTQYSPSSMLHTNVPPPAAPPAVPQPAMAAAPNQNLAAPQGPANPVVPVPPAPNPAPANQNMRMNAGVGAAVDDDEQEGGNRDWLDWIYTFCRMGVMLSIVYFYSSLNRFLVVISAMVFIYLYQGGWFQLQRGRPGVREAQEVVPGDQQPAEEADDTQPVEDQTENNTEDDAAAENPEDVETEDANTEGDTIIEDPAPEVPPRPGVIATAWIFISTFFTSLLPMDPANLPAN